jgi:hypothetical protein
MVFELNKPIWTVEKHLRDLIIAGHWDNGYTFKKTDLFDPVDAGFCLLKPNDEEQKMRYHIAEPLYLEIVHEELKKKKKKAFYTRDHFPILSTWLERHPTNGKSTSILFQVFCLYLLDLLFSSDMINYYKSP